MYTNPDRISQLAREHHHQLLAQASQRRLAAAAPDSAAGITRRLAVVIGRAAVVIARAAVVIADAPGRYLTGRPGSARRISTPAGPIQAVATTRAGQET
jgi:hypothetical protein